jgi:hypothetical protein
MAAWCYALAAMLHVISTILLHAADASYCCMLLLQLHVAVVLHAANREYAGWRWWGQGGNAAAGPPRPRRSRPARVRRPEWVNGGSVGYSVAKVSQGQRYVRRISRLATRVLPAAFASCLRLLLLSSSAPLLPRYCLPKLAPNIAYWYAVFGLPKLAPP